MLLHEMAISGRRAYWTWVVCVLAVIAAGFACYLRQLDQGLVLTGLNRDALVGLYIGQFTFTVGIAASAVMLVLLYYLHHSREFGKLVILRECVAIAAVV